MNAPERALPRANLTVLDGVAIMVGIVVGIGIFKTPPLVAANVGSETAFIGVWLFGGLVTLIGALCYAELAASYPSAGGEYHFLFRAYGRSMAVLFAWARGTVIQTGAIALVAFVFGDYATQILSLGTYSSAIYAALAVILLTGINLIGTTQSTRTQHVFTGLTLVTVLIVIVAGLIVTANGPQAPASPGSGGGGGAVGLAMVFVLLTYGGWNEAAYMSAEMRDPKRNMARVLVLGTLVLVLIYGLMNFAYLHAFGLPGLRASEAPAADLMRRAGGAWGAAVLSFTVCCAALSTLNGTIFTGARVYYALGRDLPLLARLGAWDQRGETPTNGLLVQAVIALALVLFGAAARDGFQAMVDYTAPVFWFFMLLVGVGLFVLRQREPARERPFRVPLYPVTPLVFCLTCAYLLYSSLAYTGLGSLVGIAVLAAGAPLLLLGRSAGQAMPAE
jgi:basic amino acid/polyamine antiporter, APA family